MVASLSPMIAGGSEALAEDAARHDSDLRRPSLAPFARQGLYNTGEGAGGQIR
jgi:hypothetical protein